MAPLRSTVLVTGETGTGKGVVARALHALSPRGALPFVHVDCAALSPGVVESELFGHERGAFTGAVERRSGCFERAAAGTLFLDEIGDLEPSLQRKLLRVLQDREYERIGGARTLPMTARVVAATHADLPRAVEDGRFRRDLYYRLNVVHLRVPALRERHGDLPGLIERGFERLAGSLGRRPPALDAKAHERLARHRWPGNVRELLNVLERLAVRHPGRTVTACALDGVLEDGDRSFAPRRVSAAAARARLDDALRASDGNVALAARHLGIPRSTLRYRLRRLGLR